MTSRPFASHVASPCHPHPARSTPTFRPALLKIPPPILISQCSEWLGDGIGDGRGGGRGGRRKDKQWNTISSAMTSLGIKTDEKEPAKQTPRLARSREWKKTCKFNKIYYYFKTCCGKVLWNILFKKASFMKWFHKTKS